jgi:hypothetical protein
MSPSNSQVGSPTDSFDMSLFFDAETTNCELNTDDVTTSAVVDANKDFTVAPNTTELLDEDTLETQFALLDHNLNMAISSGLEPLTSVVPPPTSQSLYTHSNDHIDLSLDFDVNMDMTSPTPLFDEELLTQIDNVINSNSNSNSDNNTNSSNAEKTIDTPQTPPPPPTSRMHTDIRRNSRPSTPKTHSNHLNQNRIAKASPHKRIPSLTQSPVAKQGTPKGMAQTAAMLATTSSSPTSLSNAKRYESARAAARAVGGKTSTTATTTATTASASATKSTAQVKPKLNTVRSGSKSMSQERKPSLWNLSAATTSSGAGAGTGLGVAFAPTKISLPGIHAQPRLPRDKIRSSSCSVYSSTTIVSNTSTTSGYSSGSSTFSGDRYRDLGRESTETLETIISAENEPEHEHETELPLTPVSRTTAKFSMLQTSSPTTTSAIITATASNAPIPVFIPNGPKLSTWKIGDDRHSVPTSAHIHAQAPAHSHAAASESHSGMGVLDFTGAKKEQRPPLTQQTVLRLPTHQLQTQSPPRTRASSVSTESTISTGSQETRMRMPKPAPPKRSRGMSMNTSMNMNMSMNANVGIDRGFFPLNGHTPTQSPSPSTNSRIPQFQPQTNHTHVHTQSLPVLKPKRSRSLHEYSVSSPQHQHRPNHHREGSQEYRYGTGTGTGTGIDANTEGSNGDGDVSFRSLLTTFNRKEPERRAPRVYESMVQGLVEFQVKLGGHKS